ncbi:MAG: zinc metalloprotease [bacterium]
MINASVFASGWMSWPLAGFWKSGKLGIPVALLFSCLFFSPAVNGQQTTGNYGERLDIYPQTENERCGYMYYEKMLQQLYPDRQTTDEFEQWLKEKIAKGDYGSSREVITIPVVVHVIHSGEEIGEGLNISEEQVLSQIEVLNEDFRRLNADAANTPEVFASVAADAQIEFCLATVTPDGEPTNGITRYDGVFQNQTMYSMENTIKPATIWNPYYYLNIWVCNLSTYLGYAQFPDGSGLPGMPPDIEQDGKAYTDGVVIRFTAFGTTGTAEDPYHLGRTTTHEVGHFFGLRHIWGDSDENGYSCDLDDFCDDTPRHLEPNYSSDENPCEFPGPNSCIEEENDLPDMFMNFMDYSDDECQNLFTLDQKTRFQAVTSNSPRRDYSESLVCQGIAPPANMPPYNDLCENAEIIKCEEEVLGTTIDATFDEVETCGVANTGPGVWFKYQVEEPSIVFLNVCEEGDFTANIAVLSGDCVDLACLASAADGEDCSNNTHELKVYAEPGQTYYVLVSSAGETDGDFTIEMDCFETAENDLCENAIEIECGDRVYGGTRFATHDGISSCATSITAPGVWYKFVATKYRTNLSTCGDAYYDIKLSVFSGSCDDLECVAGDDNGTVGCEDDAYLTFNTVPGETYYVLVHGENDDTGGFYLTLNCPDPPENDVCANAFQLACGDVVSGNTEFASNRDAPADCAGSDPFKPGLGVWYTIEGTGGDIILSTCDEEEYFDNRIDVYTGSCEDLICHAGNDDSPDCVQVNAKVTFSTETGATYYVYVSGNSQVYGDYTLKVTCCVVADAGQCGTVYYGYEPAQCTDLTASYTYGVEPYSFLWSTGETTETITVCPEVTTTYTVTITDGNGCSSTAEVDVEVVDVRCGSNMDKVELCHFPPDNPGNPNPAEDCGRVMMLPSNI